LQNLFNPGSRLSNHTDSQVRAGRDFDRAYLKLQDRSFPITPQLFQNMAEEIVKAAYFRALEPAVLETPSF
jgi:hypothetical protein